MEIKVKIMMFEGGRILELGSTMVDGKEENFNLKCCPKIGSGSDFMCQVLLGSGFCGVTFSECL